MSRVEKLPGNVRQLLAAAPEDQRNVMTPLFLSCYAQGVVDTADAAVRFSRKIVGSVVADGGQPDDH